MAPYGYGQPEPEPEVQLAIEAFDDYDLNEGARDNREHSPEVMA